MTKNGIRHIATFNRTALICATAAMALAGCNLTAEQKAAAAAKRAAPTAVVMPATKGEAAEGGLAKYQDGYPNFGAPLTAANVQMSDEQAAELQHQLTALAARRKAGALSEAEYQAKVAEMRRLAAEHGTDTLSEISK
ncbi:hypothetical protein E0H35_18140 [Rhizobium leguminosarum bv. viciae]|uniref:hypothetical protein n=1 Tax=Rhizobium leguminosarum TaxID=384 RepID=UPI0010323B21|nr:hypothetical protein [Rhizobium leguminosarum]MBY5343679.1 hypothetical protein [Rhizobium leguminosarum]NKK47614.1 hypothetical protein [Rhizobium leguminosarum bv. viciae]TBG84470.1 hypothetical protein ELG69_10285 [Rhizobium leguminosarum]TBY97992.1 hypothetical protein E0H35_18140 [Rhizobium leguminosarum bv. viciae]